MTRILTAEEQVELDEFIAFKIATLKPGEKKRIKQLEEIGQYSFPSDFDEIIEYLNNLKEKYPGEKLDIEVDTRSGQCGAADEVYFNLTSYHYSTETSKEFMQRVSYSTSFAKSEFYRILDDRDRKKNRLSDLIKQRDKLNAEIQAYK